ncbi:MAG: hypothetical protein EZS28_047838, partial [Streblomastix strix]
KDDAPDQFHQQTTDEQGFIPDTELREFSTAKPAAGRRAAAADAYECVPSEFGDRSARTWSKASIGCAGGLLCFGGFLRVTNQQMEQAAIQTVERLQSNTTSTRSVHNMLIPPIPAYPQQQIPRIPLQPYTTERNQEYRQSQRSISPTHKKPDESDDDDFPYEIIPGIIIPHLPPYKRDIESAQRIWQSRGYDLARDPSVIKYKNSKWYRNLVTQKPFTFRDYREFQIDAGLSLEQINIPHNLSKEYKSQSPRDKSRRNESIRINQRERQYAIDN